ncbi:DUF6446 family protein [Sagittula sp.]|uniref:DUF6446 family protein n=1 Tax=Sagittula sp. TaxID=2038081 RepID=UPI0040582DDD
MSGKVIGIGIVLVSLIFGAVVYYTQVYYYYEPVQATGRDDVLLTNMVTDAPEAILYDNFEAIDADSSPIRYRACFTTTLSLAMLTETYEPYEGAVPRNAPAWFTCFDAEAIAEDIGAGRAMVFAGQRNIEYGIDRVVAITEDGHGYVWEEVNECGDKAYDGTPLGEDCPVRD